MAAAFECVSLSKSFGSVRALENVNIQLQPGRVVGLLGPNGSGKTTLIKLANGLLTPSEGQILIYGQRPGPATKALVSYLPDKLHLPEWMSAEQLINMYADFYADFDREKAGEMLARLDLSSRKKLSQMSKGTKEKVQLILTMSRKAKLYLLDEPIGGVDPATRDYILRTIIGNYNEDASVVLSTHLIADVEQVLDEVIFLQNGRVERHTTVDAIRGETGKSVDELFREVFKC